MTISNKFFYYINTINQDKLVNFWVLNCIISIVLCIMLDIYIIFIYVYLKIYKFKDVEKTMAETYFYFFKNIYYYLLFFE